MTARMNPQNRAFARLEQHEIDLLRDDLQCPLKSNSAFPAEVVPGQFVEFDTATFQGNLARDQAITILT